MKDYSNKHLHIVSMDVPYPPDYGGVIDVFYKVKALASLGIQIHLHCFQYGRPEQEELNKYCASVHYYPRKTGWKGLSLKHPYMMYSRRSDELLQNLIAIDAPILLEGVHCAYYLNHPALKDRRILLRNQNIEADYFHQLQYRVSHPLKKLYYKVEAKLLAKTESKLHAAYAFVTVAMADYEHFKKLYPKHIHAYIPSFTEAKDIDTLPTGHGNYVLYHGNLGHPENEEAAIYILNHIVPQCPHIPFYFAGKAPQAALLREAQKHNNVTIVANPDDAKMQELISNAHIHLLLTFQATGLKLKLLAAYQNGRHIIANDAMLVGSNLSSICHIANDAHTTATMIHHLMKVPFTQQDIESRKMVHLTHYDAHQNAIRIAELAYDTPQSKK